MEQVLALRRQSFQQVMQEIPELFYNWPMKSIFLCKLGRKDIHLFSEIY
jgi:hypothetical protein